MTPRGEFKIIDSEDKRVLLTNNDIKDVKEGSPNRLDYIFDFKTGETTLFNLYKPFNKDIMQVEAQYNGLLFIQTDWKVQNTKLDELYIPSWMLISPEDYLHSNLNGQEFTLLPLEHK